jgi:hypothetical protein
MSEQLGMRVATDDPCSILLDDGTVVKTRSPVAELFVSEGVRYARTRPPGATADVIRAVVWVRHVWEAFVLHATRFSVDGDTLTTPEFARRFPGAVRAVVQLADGAFVVAFDARAAERNLVALERDGRERWTFAEPHVGTVTRYDDPFFPDVLRIAGADYGALLHPWDGRRIISWVER